MNKGTHKQRKMVRVLTHGNVQATFRSQTKPVSVWRHGSSYSKSRFWQCLRGHTLPQLHIHSGGYAIVLGISQDWDLGCYLSHSGERSQFLNNPLIPSALRSHSTRSSPSSTLTPLQYTDTWSSTGYWRGIERVFIGFLQGRALKYQLPLEEIL